MLNQFILVGRVNNINKINDKECIITLEIPRPFKNKNGEYENDYVDVIVKGEVAKTTMEHVVNNGIIGVKGRFVKTSDMTTLKLNAEKITFLSQYKESEEE